MTRKTHLCVAPAKHLGFKPARTQEALSHARPPLLPLPSSTSAELVGVFVSPATFFFDALAESAPLTGVLGLAGSGADKRLILCFPAVT